MGRGEGRGEGRGAEAEHSCCYRVFCFPCWILEGACVVVCDAVKLVLCCPCRCLCGCPKLDGEL